MKTYLEAIKYHIEAHPPNFGDGESILTMLYECYNENNPYENEQIRADFNELYRQMNGMPPGRWMTLYTRFVGCVGITKRLVSLGGIRLGTIRKLADCHL